MKDVYYQDKISLITSPLLATLNGRPVGENLSFSASIPNRWAMVALISDIV